MPDIRYRVRVDVPTEGARKGTEAVRELDHHMKATEDHAKKAGGAMSAVLRMLGLQAAGFHSVGLAAHEARESTSEFLEFVGAEAALEVLKEIAEKVVEIGEEMIVSAGKAERMNRVMDIAAGGMEGGEHTRKWLEEFSKASEFTEETNELAYVALKKVGIDQTHAGLFMKAAADVAAVSANKDEAYQAAIDSFARMQIQGRVEARSLMPLGVGVQDIKALGGKYAHMNVQQLNQVLSQGKFDQGQLFKLIMSRAHETKLGTRSADNVDLLSTKLEKLQELPERFYKKLADTRAVGDLGHAIDGVLEKFDPNSPAGAKTFGAMESLMESVAGAVSDIDFGAVADSLRTDVIPMIKEMIDLIKPAMHLVEKTVSFLHTAFVGGKVAAKAIADPLGAAADVIHGKGVEKSAWEKLRERGALPSQHDQPSTLADLTGVTFFNQHLGGNYIRDTLMNPEWWHTKSGEVRDSAATVGVAAAEGIASGMSKASGQVSDAAAAMSEAGEDAVRSSWKVHSPSVVFEDLGGMAAAGLTRGLGKGAGDVAVAADRLAAIPAVSSGQGGPISVQIHVGGISLAHGGKAEGEAAADAFDKRIRGIIVDVLEQAQQAGGR